MVFKEDQGYILKFQIEKNKKNIGKYKEYNNISFKRKKKD